MAAMTANVSGYKESMIYRIKEKLPTWSWGNDFSITRLISREHHSFFVDGAVFSSIAIKLAFQDVQSN